MRYRTRRPGFVASAIAVGVVLAVSNGHAATGHAAIPDGNAYTPSSWAGALLSAGGWPQTACNLGAIEASDSPVGHRVPSAPVCVCRRYCIRPTEWVSL